jgi:hypothetical protein
MDRRCALAKKQKTKAVSSPTPYVPMPFHIGETCYEQRVATTSLTAGRIFGKISSFYPWDHAKA